MNWLWLILHVQKAKSSYQKDVVTFQKARESNLQAFEGSANGKQLRSIVHMVIIVTNVLISWDVIVL